MESLLVNLINKIASELPWARTVDEDYGQLEALDDENIDMYPLTFPAILIDMPGTEWSDAGDLILVVMDENCRDRQETIALFQRIAQRAAASL